MAPSWDNLPFTPIEQQHLLATCLATAFLALSLAVLGLVLCACCRRGETQDNAVEAEVEYCATCVNAGGYCADCLRRTEEEERRNRYKRHRRRDYRDDRAYDDRGHHRRVDDRRHDDRYRDDRRRHDRVWKRRERDDHRRGRHPPADEPRRHSFDRYRRTPPVEPSPVYPSSPDVAASEKAVAVHGAYKHNVPEPPAGGRGAGSYLKLQSVDDSRKAPSTDASYHTLYGLKNSMLERRRASAGAPKSTASPVGRVKQNIPAILVCESKEGPCDPSKPKLAVANQPGYEPLD